MKAHSLSDLIKRTERLGSRPANVPSEQFIRSRSVILANGCWLWENATQHGYGQVTVYHQTIRAHRLSWMVFRGAIPENKLVCHTCDNRRCVNPDHLFIGTIQDNSDDKLRKGRQRNLIGEMHCRAKLSGIDVLRIRKACSDGLELQKQIAKRFGVSPSVVSEIRNRKLWKHL